MLEEYVPGTNELTTDWNIDDEVGSINRLRRRTLLNVNGSSSLLSEDDRYVIEVFISKNDALCAS